MPCPYFSQEKNDCLLLEETPGNEEEESGIPLEDTVQRDWCLSDRAAYRNCPTFRQHLVDLLR